jgi:hypothetical protein
MAEVDRVYDDVRIRDVEEADLDVLFEHQRDPEAVRMAAFAAKAREPFFAYWAEIGDHPVAQRLVLGEERV